MNPQAGAYIGVAFGLQCVRVVVADVSHSILATDQHKVGTDYTLEAALSAAEDLVRTSIAAAAVRKERVLGVCVAVPSPIDPGTGAVIGTSIVPTWEGVEIRALLEDRFGPDVIVDNDANCGAMAEYVWGAGRRRRSLLYVKLDNGVGGAIVLDGHLLRGVGGVAGEIGHITLDPSGPLCRCGGRGCLETYVGIPALVAQLRPRYDETVTAEQLLELVAAGDPTCQRLIQEAADTVGQALGTVANIFAPEIVVIGGKLSEIGDPLLDPLRASFLRHSILGRRRPAASATEIVRGRYRDDASALGAVALALAQPDPRPHT